MDSDGFLGFRRVVRLRDVDESGVIAYPLPTWSTSAVFMKLCTKCNAKPDSEIAELIFHMEKILNKNRQRTAAESRRGVKYYLGAAVRAG
jgi:hypothetical protein